MIEILLGPLDFESFFSERPKNAPFSDNLISFVGSFSHQILSAPALKSYPDLIALGFWMRPAHLHQLKSSFEQASAPSRVRVPKGTVLHFAPSNVDTLFAYSLLISLLLGNRNIVRVSRKSNVVKNLIINQLATVLSRPQFKGLENDLIILSYSHDLKISTRLSDHCDCRIIWGGDQTVSSLSTIPLPPWATEIKFADKWSLAVFDAQKVEDLCLTELKKLVNDFLNDSYWYGQQACSSPRIVVWHGSKLIVDLAQERFWTLVDSQLQHFNHHLNESDLVNKFNTICQIASKSDCHIISGQNNLLIRLQLQNPASSILQNHCGSGLFYEYHTEKLDQLEKILNRQTQTITFFGIAADQIKEVVMKKTQGVDRIVPCGQALNFDIHWDGYDLFEELTRGITLKF